MSSNAWPAVWTAHGLRLLQNQQRSDGGEKFVEHGVLLPKRRGCGDCGVLFAPPIVELDDCTDACRIEREEAAITALLFMSEASSSLLMDGEGVRHIGCE